MASSTPVYNLKSGNLALRNGVIFGIVLIAIYIALLLLIAPSIGRSAEALSSFLIIAAMLSLFFSPAVYVCFSVALTGSVKRSEPIEWEFFSDKIRYKFQFGGWKKIVTNKIKGIELKEVWSHYSAENIIWKNVKHNEIEFTVIDGSNMPSTLYIGLDRSRDFNVATETIFSKLQQIYPSNAFTKTQTPEPKQDGELFVGMTKTILANRIATLAYLFGHSALFALISLISTTDLDGAKGDALIFAVVFLLLGIAAFFFIFNQKEPLAIEIGKNYFVFRYLFNKRKVDFADIKELKLVLKPTMLFTPNQSGKPYSAALKNYRNLEISLKNGDRLFLSERSAESWSLTIDSIHLAMDRVWRGQTKS